MKKLVLTAALLVCLGVFGNPLVSGEEAFFELVKTGSPEEVKQAIEEGAEVDALIEGGWTPLMLSARYNQSPEVTELLLEAGADGKITCNLGKTAFDYAQDNEHLRHTEAYWLLNEARY